MARTYRAKTHIKKRHDHFYDEWLNDYSRRFGSNADAYLAHRKTDKGCEGRNASSEFRRTQNRLNRHRMNNELRAEICHCEDFEEIDILPRTKRDVNWLWF